MEAMEISHRIPYVCVEHYKNGRLPYIGARLLNCLLHQVDLI